VPGEIADQAQRQRAIDPLRSFCVSAPAGSGKTELLIQRFLTLLARVDYPEEILAITFTRKAAAEMRARIIEALRRAGTEPRPEDAHSAQTWELASLALARDRDRNWQLLQNPGRLGVRTIDSFCASLTRQLPVLSGFGGPLAPVDDCMPAYRQATRSLLEMLGDEGAVAEDLGRVLLQFDGNWGRLEELLIGMLRCRDQWLVHMGTGLDPEQAQGVLEHSVGMLIEDGLLRLAEQLEDLVVKLHDFGRYRADQLGIPFAEHPLGTGVDDLPTWKSLVDLCLTAEGEWRKTVTVKQGFPPKSKDANTRKDEFLEFLADLRDRRGLLSQLREVRSLPSVQAKDEHWQLLLAVSRLLPMLAAQLSVAFQQRAEVDHTHVAMAALDALGPDDRITDLAQKLDYRLHHILVDEFQDTSITQYSLLQRLTRGWAEDNENNPDNPRTLFIVGDGMQSIYGFREADVGLFVRARETGFSGVSLEPLELLSNFRSDARLVDWANRVFQPAFPRRDDMRLGEVRFSPAVAERPAGPAEPATLSLFEGGREGDPAEAAWLAEQLEAGLADESCESIAVLVRTRSHLVPIVEELKSRGIEWQAQEIDLLSHSPLVRDLQNLCRALHNRADRVAWLALLRAPWCALSLADLEQVAAEAKEQSVWQALQSHPAISPAGRKNVERLLQAVASAEYWRERLGLRDWIESTWLALGGPACATDGAQLQDAAEFFALLETLDNRGEPYDEGWLEQQVASLYSSVSSADSKLQLMTLHKAKGLEFDWVFMPGLGREPRQDQRALLLWDDYHRSADSELGFLLAVNDRESADEDTLYNYLARQKKHKQQQEKTRLLYVGVTRAAQRLFLSASQERSESGDWKPPPRTSLLHSIWESFAVEADTPSLVAAAQREVEGIAANLRLQGLPDLPALADPAADPADRNLPQAPGEPLPRQVGTVIHLSLERLSQLGDAELASYDASQLEQWWKVQLSGRGVLHAQLPAALEQVRQSVTAVLADGRGRHIISASREAADSELALSALRADGRLAEYVIDRTYVEDNVRWVVDYKSSVPDSGQSLEDFLAREAESYGPQLENYRQLMRTLDDRDVRTALYFTAIPHWLELT